MVTFKKATDIQEAAKELPLKILLKQMHPYLAPVPWLAEKIKQLPHTCYVVDFIAELRGLTTEEVARLDP